MVLKGRLRDRTRDESGAVAVLVAILSTTLLVAAALIVDLGLARDQRGQAQATADASALAAANVLYPVSGVCTAGEAYAPCFTDAVNEAKKYAQLNFATQAGEWTAASAGCTADSGYSQAPLAGARTPCVTFDSLTDPTRVKVRIPNRQVRAGFGGVTGTNEITVGSAARAEVQEGVAVKCALCFLGGVDTQNSDFEVENGGIAVGGDVEASSGNSEWTASAIYLEGEKGSKVTMTPEPTRVPDVPDPFALDSRFPPSTIGLPARSGSPCGKGPGNYSGNWTANNGSDRNCVLSAGLYVVNGTWGLRNNTVLDASAGVTIFVQPTGALDFKNSGDISIVAPTAAQVAGGHRGVAGFAIVYDRSNVHTLSLQGNGVTAIDGGVYAPAAELDFNGTSDFVFNRGPVVAASIVGRGGGNKSTVRITNAIDQEVATLPGDIALDQ